MTYDDVMEIENGGQPQLEHFQAMQRQINSGLVWRLQGSFGRAAMDAIESGLVMLGQEGHRDYWGNYVPSRFQVEPGTKGTIEYVQAHTDEDWAASMEGQPGGAPSLIPLNAPEKAALGYLAAKGAKI